MDNPRPSTSKGKRSRSKRITGAKICELVNDSDLDGYDLEERNYLSAEQEITLPEPQPEQEITTLEPQPDRGQKRKCQAT
jgi:hypothetical protein